MILNFNNIINKEKNKSGFVIGLGPSLKEFANDFETMSKTDNDKVFICCNDHDKMFNLETNYWVIANAHMPIRKIFNRYNSKPNCTLVFADSVDLTSSKEIDNKLKINYIPFDQRHFNGQKCSVCKTYGCENKFVEGRKTIQEVLQEHTGYSERYGSGDTVAVHMFALAVLLGCNPIYITGVDLDYTSSGHYFKEGFKAHPEHHNLPSYVHRIYNDMKTIYNSAQKIGIDSFTISKVKLSETIPFKDIKKL